MYNAIAASKRGELRNAFKVPRMQIYNNDILNYLSFIAARSSPEQSSGMSAQHYAAKLRFAHQ